MNFEEKLETKNYWREEELYLLNRIYINLNSNKERDLFLKSIILQTYAHIEGMVTSMVNILLEELSSISFHCKDMNEKLLTFYFEEKLKDLTENTKKPFSFDKKTDQLSVYLALFNNDLDFSTLSADTKDNLSPSVLKMICYKLGILLDVSHLGKLDILVKKRNSISHSGLSDTALSIDDIKDYREIYFNVYTTLKDEFMNFIRAKAYLKND